MGIDIGMKNLTFENMARVCGGRLYNFDRATDKEVSGVVLDSRKIEENYLFVATKGERVDGHDFIPEVLTKGVAGVVSERLLEDVTAPYILVEDSLQALKDIAEFYREQLNIKVVGITGSVGKTSTKEFIASVLSMKYKTLKTEGNFNNEIGLPLTVLRLRDDHQAAVLEMGISDFGEMRRLSKVAKPDICVITNIGQCHLENLGSREGILEAKTEIFDYMKEDGFVCLNGDDDMLRKVKMVHGRRPLRFGLGRSNEFYAGSVNNKGLFGSSALIHIGDTSLEAEIPLPGSHMIYNALAAASVGTLLGLTKAQIQKGIASVRPLGGRSNIIRRPDKVIIDDCYNANPVSMCAALDLLAMASTRRVAVLGDMFELGDNTSRLHARVGAYAAEKRIHVIICIGELSKYIYEGVCGVLKELPATDVIIRYFADKAEFMESIPEILREKDTILVKASHGMAFEDIVKQLEDTRLVCRRGQRPKLF